jgi:hypothetical protein
MNNPANPNRFTIFLMILLGVSFMFLIGIAYQSYQTDKAMDSHSAKTVVNAKLLRDINDTKHRNEILLIAQNKQMEKNMIIFNSTLNKVFILLQDHSHLMAEINHSNSTINTTKK